MTRRLPLFALLVLVAAAQACKSRSQEPDAGPPQPPCQAIADTPLCWRLPAGWALTRPEKSAIQEPASASGAAPAGAVEDAGPGEDAGTGLLAETELLLRGQREDPRVPSRHPPRVEVYRSRLPARSSSTDFLVANRLSQQRALGEIQVRHLEVEPIRRDGRHGFHIRDAFDVPLPQGGQAPVSQQAVLLIDGRRGYVVVVTLLEDELPRYQQELRAWLGSLSFEAR